MNLDAQNLKLLANQIQQLIKNITQYSQVEFIPKIIPKQGWFIFAKLSTWYVTSVKKK